MTQNGRLPTSALAPIAGGHLEKHAAAAWNAMNAESQRRFHVTLLPLGDMSSYRTLPQQEWLWDHVPHAHDPNWVARPGTSNHGLGVAVDLRTRQMRWIVDQIGRHYGFSKACSDAPVEWWHIKYNPACTGATWKPGRPVLHHGNHGPDVRTLQHLLRTKHVLGAPKNTGVFGKATLTAVKRFQRKHHLHADGVVGPATWRALLA